MVRARPSARATIRIADHRHDADRKSSNTRSADEIDRTTPKSAVWWKPAAPTSTSAFVVDTMSFDPAVRRLGFARRDRNRFRLLLPAVRFSCTVPSESKSNTFRLPMCPDAAASPQNTDGELARRVAKSVEVTDLVFTLERARSIAARFRGKVPKPTKRGGKRRSPKRASAVVL